LLGSTIFDEDVKMGGEHLGMYCEYVSMVGVLV
jgi:hypothetical protein